MIEEIFMPLLTNGKEVSFFVLFVGLFIYSLRTNDIREQKYRDTIDSLTETLKDVSEIKETVNEINEKINQ